MPTYEYKCEKCGHRFERLQGITDEPLKKCPECGGKIKRMISAGAGIIFKGNGFYQTDYKNAASKDKNKPSEDKPKDDSKPGSCGKPGSCPCCS